MRGRIYLEAPNGFEPLHKGFVDYINFAILLIRFALWFLILAVFGRFSAPNGPKLFPNLEVSKGLKNLYVCLAGNANEKGLLFPYLMVRLGGKGARFRITSCFGSLPVAASRMQSFARIPSGSIGMAFRRLGARGIVRAFPRTGLRGGEDFSFSLCFFIFLDYKFFSLPHSGGQHSFLQHSFLFDSQF